MTSPRQAIPNPIARWIAHGFGSGLAPKGPGTAGSALALVPVFFVPAESAPWILGGAALVSTLVCAAIARRMRGPSDPGWFVQDEFAGQWVASAFAVSGGPWTILSSFVLFRLFDISKPYPIRRLERVGGGYGIVLDDILAGLYALLVLVVGRTILHSI